MKETARITTAAESCCYSGGRGFRPAWRERAAAVGRAARGFHHREHGMEALQVVMIVAIAAVCLIVIRSKWVAIRDWFTEMVDIAIEV